MSEREKMSRSRQSGVVVLIFLLLFTQLIILIFSDRENESVGYIIPIEERQQDSRKLNSIKESSSIGRRMPIAELTEDGESSKKRSIVKRDRVPKRVFKRRAIERFNFDPNSASKEQFCKLGFSSKQADVILKYRDRGGIFRKKEDFAKVFVVSDSIYRLLSPYIFIEKSVRPLVELNSADSLALISLTGIGPYYAKKILDYRERLGGIFNLEQLLEIRGVDRERLELFKLEVCIDSTVVRRLNFATDSISILESHPYIGRSRAKSIVRYREVCGLDKVNLNNLLRDRVLDSIAAKRVSPYLNIIF